MNVNAKQKRGMRTEINLIKSGKEMQRKIDALKKVHRDTTPSCEKKSKA